jgi:hypothetical protein
MKWLPLAALGAIGAYFAFGSKPKAAAQSSTVAVKTPAGSVQHTQSGTTITVPDITVPAPSGNALDNSYTLNTDEQTYVANATDDELYATGIASNHLGFVIAAADLLAQHGDTRAMDLTVRIAQWGKA